MNVNDLKELLLIEEVYNNDDVSEAINNTIALYNSASELTDLNPVNNILLEAAIYSNLIEATNFILKHNADPNALNTEKKYSLFTAAVIEENIEIIDLLLTSTEIKILPRDYAIIIMSSNFHFLTKIINKISYCYDAVNMPKAFKALGISSLETKTYLDFYDLANDYILTKNGISTSLGEIDMNILEPAPIFYLLSTKKDVEKYNNTPLTNKYGYNPLHLSIIAGKYKLASELLTTNSFDLSSKTHNNATPLHILPKFSGESDEHILAFIEDLLKNIKNIDLLLDSGGNTLADKLIGNDFFTKKIIELSNDPLFSFLKDDADLFSPSKNLNNTHIAISDGKGFWSTGAWSNSRILRENHPNLMFHLVRPGMLPEDEESFLSQFDAIINPGGADSFPYEFEIFNITQCPLSIPIEAHYQNMLKQSNKLNIPYLGACAGAQHLSLYHGGSLEELEGYESGYHQINFIKGTLSYFISLTKEQQEKALSHCEFPEISFVGDTAHHYAVVKDKLGDHMQLGAVSEGNIPMAYASSNGIRYATQYHPEIRYHEGDDNAVHQKAWLDNFVGLAQMHHDYRVNNATHPIKYYEQVTARLEECLAGQNSFVDEL